MQQERIAVVGSQRPAQVDLDAAIKNPYAALTWKKSFAADPPMLDCTEAEFSGFAQSDRLVAPSDHVS
jgi:hypothetical protein